MCRLFRLVILLVPVNVTATGFSSLYTFGDSLSDPGNIPRISGIAYPPPPYSNHRFSNGPVAVQYLAPLLCLPVTNDNNYAQGGATTGFDNIFNATNGGPVPGSSLSGVLDQVQRYLLATRRADPRGLYVIWAGPNDLLQGLQNPATFDAPAAIGRALGNVSTIILNLTNAGARHFLILNMPDLGKTPRMFGTPYQTRGTQLSIAFNQGLARTLTSLQSGLDVRIIPFDTFSLLNTMIAKPEEYGYTHVSSPCIQQPACVADPATAAAYLFWDDLHPTTSGHQVLARAMAHKLSLSLPTAVPCTYNDHDRCNALNTQGEDCDERDRDHACEDQDDRGRTMHGADAEINLTTPGYSDSYN